MKRFLTIFSLVGAVGTACLLMTSCGTITGLNSEVTFDSNPQGAEVLIDNLTRGKTPIKLKLKNNTDYNVVLRYQGYTDYNHFVGSDISGGTIVADILLTGLTGIVVDAVTGGFYKDKELDNKVLLFDFIIGKPTIKSGE
jgi:hypothetical protein